MSRIAERQTLHIAAKRYDVAVVGGGFAGTVVAVQLARLATAPLSIVMFDRAGAFGRGAAYSPASDNCILNVRAKAMGAFPDAEGDFLAWLRATGYAQDDPDLGERFLPRRLYGQYLCALLERCTANGVTIDRQTTSIAEVTVADGGYLLNDGANRRVFANSVVLALGNLPPSGLGEATLSAALVRHARNPWALLARESVDRDAEVFIVGTGLSALDILLELHAGGHRGRITMLSRHGRFPLPHAPSRPNSTAVPFAPIGGAPRDVLRGIRRLVRDAAPHGPSWQDVIDGLRPQTNRIWQNWSSNEQRQFDRHLASLWGIHRHRAPPATLAVCDALVAAGQLHVHSGRLTGLSPIDSRLRITYADRHSDDDVVVDADIVVDCSGPPRDIRRSGDPLIAALFARGLVRPGSLGLGFAAAADGAVHRADAAATLYALGTPLRGTLCESSAVREIRIQARAVAEAIVASVGGRAGVGRTDSVEEETA